MDCKRAGKRSYLIRERRELYDIVAKEMAHDTASFCALYPIAWLVIAVDD